ncbi:MAG: response regulator, partial [Bacteroidota bacterium]
MLDNKYTILYVDDEEANLRVFKSAFKWEYHVLIANSGMEGLEVLEHNDVQLVITDQRMPEMTGVEFLEKVVEKYPDVIRVILTGYSDMEAIVDAINKGKIYYYIRKPWNEEDVKITIDKALEAYGLKKENKNLIESLKNKNEELQHSNQELDLFIYRASHDLKGPVATFLGLIELARRGNVDNNVLGGLEDTARKMDKMLIKLRMVNSINSSELE